MTTPRESLFAPGLPPLEHLDLSDRYMNTSPGERFEIVREIRLGERCPHGYPDQGEGCEACCE